MALRRRHPTWSDVLEEHAANEATCARFVAQLAAREAALRHAADRVETALTGLEEPLDQYLLELEGDRAEGRAWYGGPGAGELIEWAPVLKRAGVSASPIRVAQAYLELAV